MLMVFPDGKIRLNLGCGSIKMPGYVNIDLHDPGADLAMDVRYLEFEDGAIDEIYSSHLLEHFSGSRHNNELPGVLKEWFRVLKSGGALRLNVPNLVGCLKNWLNKEEDEKWGFALDMIFGLQTNPGEYHKTGFTKARLEKLLTDAGFVRINITDVWSHSQQCYFVEAFKA